MNSAAAAALYERIYFIDRYAVEIAFDCVLEAGSCGCKFDSVCGGFAVYKAVYKSCAEGIAAAYAVNIMNGILL